MSAPTSRMIQDGVGDGVGGGVGGGDSLTVDLQKAGDHIKIDHSAEIPVRNLNPYEGSPTQTGKIPLGSQDEEKSCLCPHSEVKTEHQKPQKAQKPSKSVPHRRHEDQRHLLHFDYPHQVDHSKNYLRKGGLPAATHTERFSDEEMESSPFIEDKSKAMRSQRQREYRQQLSQQIAQREEKRQQQKAKRSLQADPRSQSQSQGTASAIAVATASRDSRAAVERYESQLRMEQLEDMRRQLQLKQEREVERLRRIYRKDDRKLLAHLQRLRLQDSDLHGHGEGDATIQREVAYPLKTKLLPSTQATDSKTSELKSEVSQSKHDVALPNLDVSSTDTSKISSSSKEIIPRKLSANEEQKEFLKKPHSQSSLKSTHAVGKPPTKPLTYKQAYLRLQQRRREKEIELEERRAKAAAWREELSRQERLERDVRNMAEWQSGHSLAGVPLKPIAPAHRGRVEAAASWLEKQRTAQQEKMLERDRQLMSWREAKNRQMNERRLKEKAKQKVAKEMQAERKKEAEKCFDRWLQELRARKAAEKASVPRGAIGVSTYSSEFSLPSPWRRPPRKAWRRGSFMSEAISGRGNDDVTP